MPNKFSFFAVSVCAVVLSIAWVDSNDVPLKNHLDTWKVFLGNDGSLTYKDKQNYLHSRQFNKESLFIWLSIYKVGDVAKGGTNWLKWYKANYHNYILHKDHLVALDYEKVCFGCETGGQGQQLPPPPHSYPFVKMKVTALPENRGAGPPLYNIGKKYIRNGPAHYDLLNAQDRPYLFLLLNDTLEVFASPPDTVNYNTWQPVTKHVLDVPGEYFVATVEADRRVRLVFKTQGTYVFGANFQTLEKERAESLDEAEIYVFDAQTHRSYPILRADFPRLLRSRDRRKLLKRLVRE